MIGRAFVLCGGLGTRLRDAVAGPKVLAPIAGRPFLALLADTLHAAGVRSVVLLTGHQADLVAAYVDAELRGAHPDMAFELSNEPSPLGTAGALAHAARFVDGPLLLVNGDTYLEFDAAALFAAHARHGAAVTMGAIHVPDAQRYGALEVAPDGALVRFAEKAAIGPGLVNAGAYVIEPRVVAGIAAGRAVSLEREVLPGLLAAGERVHAVTLPGSFVDIGTPETWAAFSRERAAGGRR